MKPQFVATTLALILSSAAVAADGEAFTIGVTASAPIAQLKREFEAAVPANHREGPARHICVRAKQKCIKIPEFRGLKIYSRKECVDVVPKISCDLTQNVSLNGQAVFTPLEDGLQIQQNISASARAQGRGAIGKQFRQTVRGSANVTIRLQPKVRPDWTIDPGVSLTHAWTKRPRVRLFNLITVTVGSIADREIQKVKAKLDGTTLPKLAADLRLRDKMERVWNKIQRPRKIEIGEGRAPLYIHVRPEKIAFSGISGTRQDLRAALQVQGRMMISDQSTSPWPAKSPLPALGILGPKKNAIDLTVPLEVGWSMVNEALSQRMPQEFTIPDKGKLTLHSASAGEQGGKMRIAIDATFDPDGLIPPIRTSFAVLGKAQASRNGRAMEIEEIEVEGPASIKLAVLAAEKFQMLKRAFSVSLERPLDQAETAIKTALTRPSVAVTATASVALSVADFTARPVGLSLTTRLSGSLNLKTQLGN